MRHQIFFWRLGLRVCADRWWEALKLDTNSIVNAERFKRYVVKAGLPMNRNVSLKTLSLAILILGCLTTATFADDKSKTDDHKGGAKGGKRDAATDFSEAYSPMLTELKRLRTDDSKVTVTKYKVGEISLFGGTKQDLSAADLEKIETLGQVAKDYSDDLLVCSGSGDKHASELMTLLKRCVVDTMGGTFMKPVSGGVISDTIKFLLRAGQSGDPMEAAELEYAQCQQSLKKVMDARKGVVKDTAADTKLVDALDAVMKVFGFEVDSLKKQNKDDVTKKQKELRSLAAKASSKKLLSADSCVVQLPAAPTNPVASNAGSPSPTPTATPTADSDADDEDEEEFTPPGLVYKPRFGGELGKPGAGGKPGPGTDKPGTDAAGQVIPTNGLAGGFDPSLGQNANPFINPFDDIFDRLNALRPDGARIGGSPQRSNQGPQLALPSVSPPSGGGNDKGATPPPGQTPGPMPQGQPVAANNQPILIEPPAPRAAAEKKEPTQVAAAKPEKLNLRDEEKTGFNNAYPMGLQQGNLAYAQGNNGRTPTGQKIYASNSRRSNGRLSGGARRSNGRVSSGARGRRTGTASIDGTGASLNRRSPQGGGSTVVGRGMPGMN